jgi:hypothetical protein
MDEAGARASNPAFARAARIRVFNRYIFPGEANSAKGVFKDPAVTVKSKEPEVQEKDLGADFFG